ncbi:MAG TPA: hypothetical protein VJ997_07910 [Longimicrobiales bacterium]|nr:hypothetical protein [Longimicrobiales bacterium]
MARAFLAARTPSPPPPLAAWLEAVPLGSGPVVDELLQAGLSELDRARSTSGRVRTSAFHLLAADALLTYACEAALEAHDPGGALSEILRQAAAPRP